MQTKQTDTRKEGRDQESKTKERGPVLNGTVSSCLRLPFSFSFRSHRSAQQTRTPAKPTSSSGERALIIVRAVSTPLLREVSSVTIASALLCAALEGSRMRRGSGRTRVLKRSIAIFSPAECGEFWPQLQALDMSHVATYATYVR